MSSTIPEQLTPSQEAMYKVAMVWSVLSWPVKKYTPIIVYERCLEQIKGRNIPLEITLEQVKEILELAFIFSTVTAHDRKENLEYELLTATELSKSEELQWGIV